MAMNLYDITPSKKGKIQKKRNRTSPKSPRMQISTAFVTNLYGEVDALTEQFCKSLLGGIEGGR